MDLLVRIHAEREGYVWEVLDLKTYTPALKPLYESLYLAPHHVKAEATARKQAEKYIADNAEYLRGPFSVMYQTTSEFSAQ